jgi:hypothetical protein
MEAKLFKNFTEQDFSWKFDGVPYSFKAGQEIYLEDFKAEHFAKHLVDAELQRLGVQTSDVVKRTELTARCFPVAVVVSPQEALHLNEEDKAKTKKGKKVEKEFEDLDEK